MIKLIKSTFYKEKETKRKLLQFIRKANWLSFGPECQKFEKRFAKYQQRKYSVMLNSGSSANLAIIQALLNLEKLKIGDKVGFSALTWSTNAMPLIQLGLKPIPVDVELATLNVSSNKLLTVLKNNKLKALFLTNLLGFSDDIDKVAKVCKKNKIILIEDNCESLGSVYAGKKLGNYGLASTFSFYVGHHMSTIEGGAVCTDDNELAMMINIVRAHGWDRNLDLEEQSEIRNKFNVNKSFYSRYTFYDLGYNLRPTEIAGFLGNAQLDYIDEILEKRNKNFVEMATPIYDLTDKFYPIEYEHMDFLSNFAVPVVCRSVKTRDSLVKKCKGKVEIRPVVGGDMTQQPFFIKNIQSKKSSKINTNSDIVHKKGLYFANNPELTKKEKQTIVKIFTSV
jgi:CDP-6-deoxy-D-xylo-4-hexulose-3-dehydrase